MLRIQTTLRVSVIALALFPAFALAGDRKLAEILPAFFAPGISLPLDPATGHSPHFNAQSEAFDVMLRINSGIATQFATYPLGSSSGGFTYSFDPNLGTYERNTDTFGPSFAERASTLGKRKLNVGMSYMHASYDSLDGLDLSSGEIGFNLLHEDEAGDGRLVPAFEGDIMRADLSLDLIQDTTLLFANYGITNHFDVGLVVPVIRAELDARIMMTIEPLATGAGVHQFVGGGLQQDSVEGDTATGIGDIILRAKQNFVQRWGGGLSWALDLHLPTGDAENLLGTGATQAKLYLVASGRFGQCSPHGNLGYTFSDGGTDLTGDPSDEINYTVGFDFALHPRATFVIDIVGRTLLDAERVGQRERLFQYTTPAGIGSAYRSELVPTNENLSLLSGAIGLKFNPTGGFLISVGALVPIGREAGLQDNLTAVLGVDYSF